ncbi:PAS domain S-box protein [Brevibacillus porteri]|uniref:PAS domain S-box protein n=1 Tax=Brevibacillus porteri TaxID=2126350 RepID=UPI00244C1152|nr:PAS domain S-box protein [Brevibacillus porteri]MED1801617.1 PAS domain S-box protein [Brevibacillus porteri]MED2133468.1 PAS domain S-box protein [Brevibacillus porteri]MED2743704.1 PAS domain S-box protein [Brevibacillus porteri]MED2816451.1 PAS domain S-box protein [Brevibacillus porteri]MED2893495.1 PAS domain S-box protein [Brevibacillus porteri]
MFNQIREVKYALSALEESSVISITDEKGIITYVNHNFCEISKFSREELIGENHNIVDSGFHPRDYFKSLWDTISREEKYGKAR